MTNAVTGVDGVSKVDVDISNGELTVFSETPVDAVRSHAAIKDAGYQVIGG